MRTSRTLFVLATTVLGGISLQAIAADTATTRPSARGGVSQMQGAQMPGMEGVLAATAVTTVYSVENVDQATRTVTLKAADGAITKFQCGPEVRNFDQIRQGDQVQATVVDEIAVAVSPGGQPGMGESQMITVAPKGAKPGMVMIQTSHVTGKILAVDTDKRMVSLQGPEGADKTFKVGPKVDLTQLKKGDSITLQIAEGTLSPSSAPRHPCAWPAAPCNPCNPAPATQPGR